MPSSPISKVPNYAHENIVEFLDNSSLGSYAKTNTDARRSLQGTIDTRKIEALESNDASTLGEKARIISEHVSGNPITVPNAHQIEQCLNLAEEHCHNPFGEHYAPAIQVLTELMTRYPNELNNVHSRFNNWLADNNGTNVENVVARIWTADEDKLPNLIQNVDIPLSDSFFMEYLLNTVVNPDWDVRFKTHSQILDTNRVISQNPVLTESFRTDIGHYVNEIFDHPLDFQGPTGNNHVRLIVNLALKFNERASDIQDNQTNTQLIPIPERVLDFFEDIQYPEAFALMNEDLMEF